ncbi:MAG: hypothetical protein NTY68_02240 [Candidatus Micrarchaeota archaeon]|nr:hypothetical protein [Candidatus Micrarchaeota archaeon]
MDVKSMNPLVAVVLYMFTFGLFPIYWYYKNKVELNSKGAQIPTFWLMIIPIANIYLIYKIMEGYIKVTKSSSSPIMYFIGSCIPLVNLYMVYLIQTGMNKI